MSKVVRRSPSLAAALLVVLACNNDNPPDQDSADGTGSNNSIGADTSATTAVSASASGGSTSGADSATGTSASVVTGTGGDATDTDTATDTEASSDSDEALSESSGGTGGGGGTSEPAESSGGASTGIQSCGGEEYDTEQVPPNVLILLDRSWSMNEDLGDSTRWDVALAAIRSLAMNYETQINFGLALYPGYGPECSGNPADDPSCPAGDVFFIDPAPTNSSTIDTFLDEAEFCEGTQASYWTPTGAAIAAVTDYAPLQDPERQNFLLVVTDGQAQCNGRPVDPVPPIVELREQEPEIQTFVVGFSEGAAVAAGQLTAMAEAGGRPRDGEPNYYQADDAVALEEAFAAIAGSVVSCDFTLGERPLDPNLLYVYIDGDEIDADSEEGWRYEEEDNVIRFFGSSCDRLQSGSAELRVIFGCPLPS